MIICHTLQLIFVKTKKVAGTSFEIALSKYCGPDCIITPITDEDEATRKRLGFRGAQNFKQADRIGFSVDCHHNETIKGNFRNHDTSTKIRRQIGDKLFSSYCKISIQRNPLDFLISQYFFRLNGLGHQPMAFRQWYFLNADNVLENQRIAPMRGKNACDVCLNYESLAEEIPRLSQLPVGFFDTFCALSAKGNYRAPESRNPQAFFREHGLENEIDRLLALSG